MIENCKKQEKRRTSGSRTRGMRRAAGDDSSIVISSRVRLARNLAGVAFPGWAGEVERRMVCRQIAAIAARVEELQNPRILMMDEVSPVERMVLQERHLISNELAEGSDGCALLLDESCGIAVMINEEDHLRIQALGAGLVLDDIWQRVDALDNALDSLLEYAFDEQFGFLTACPSNLGTGMRASVMLQLSGLRLTGELEQVMNALDRLGLAVRGLLGEGTEAYGNIFQISNQSSLGESEEEIVSGLQTLVQSLVRQERHARLRVLQSRRNLLDDQLGRALAILAHNRLLPSGEAIDLLATLRLGVETGMISGISSAALSGLMECIQPGHLQRSSGRGLTPEDRDAMRSQMVRSKLVDVRLSGRKHAIIPPEDTLGNNGQNQSGL